MFGTAEEEEEKEEDWASEGFARALFKILISFLLSASLMSYRVSVLPWSR